MATTTIQEVKIEIEYVGEEDTVERRGNLTLIRMLIALNKAGEAGITTMDLFDNHVRTRGHGQTTLKRAVQAGYVSREVVPNPNGQFPFVYNFITEDGKIFLKDFLGF